MTELAVRANGAVAPARLEAAQPSLQAWAEEMSAAAQIARGLAGTPFVPATLRVMDRGQVDLQATSATVAAALLTGKEVGLEPMAALRSINVINGTPALNAMAARALALSRGHEVWIVESTKTRCIAAGRRFGSDPTREPQTSSWDTDRAKDLGLLSKPNWRQQPIAMLIARATSEIVRLVAPEVLLGLGYTVEELQDQDSVSAGSEASAAASLPQPSAPPRRTAQRRNRPAAAPVSAPVPSAPTPAADEPSLDEAPASEAQGESAIPDSETVPVGPEHAQALDEEPPAQDMVTEGQLKALHAGFNALGIRNRDDRLTTTREIVGRRVESSTELYLREAATVIDELNLRRTRLAEAEEEAQLQAAYEADVNTQAGQPGEDEPPV